MTPASRVKRVVVPEVGRLPAFSSATIAEGQVFVSGTLGTKPEEIALVPGGTGAETRQALRNIETILAACGCRLSDVAKVTVYLTDMGTFAEMNDAYVDVFGAEVPARITIGCAALALGASVEIDCIAFVP